MSTDLVQLRWVDGERKLFAFSVKKNRNVPDGQQRRLDIEEAYWKEQGIPWRLLYRTDAPRNRIQNYRWIENFLPRSPLIPKKSRWREVERTLYPLVTAGIPLKNACDHVDDLLTLDEGVSLSQVRFYLCAKIWEFDFDQLIDPLAPLALTSRNLGAL